MPRLKRHRHPQAADQKVWLAAIESILAEQLPSDPIAAAHLLATGVHALGDHHAHDLFVEAADTLRQAVLEGDVQAIMDGVAMVDTALAIEDRHPPSSRAFWTREAGRLRPLVSHALDGLSRVPGVQRRTTPAELRAEITMRWHSAYEAGCEAREALREVATADAELRVAEGYTEIWRLIAGIELISRRSGDRPADLLPSDLEEAVRISAAVRRAVDTFHFTSGAWLGVAAQRMNELLRRVFPGQAQFADPPPNVLPQIIKRLRADLRRFGKCDPLPYWEAYPELRAALDAAGYRPPAVTQTV